jgi:hypothetical protein
MFGATGGIIWRSLRRNCFGEAETQVCGCLDTRATGAVLFECVQNEKGARMPRVAIEDNSRMSLRVGAKEKATLLRAVALKHTDLTDFVLDHALRAAKAVI